jgi:subtilisin family serine protease
MKNQVLKNQIISEYQINNLRHLFFMFAIVLFSLTLTSTASAKVDDKIRKAIGAIPERYIVVLDEDVNEELKFPSEVENVSQKLLSKYGGKVDKLFKYTIKGYSVEMSAAAAVLLSLDEQVKYVEEDVEVHAAATQTGATGGLDRIDQRSSSLDGIYNYTATGSGVHAYVIDSGIRGTHTDFGGRVVAGFDAFTDGQNGNDCFGHGTHVAGTIGSATYGVAKNVTLHSVRVLNCSGSGTVSGIVAAIDWVTGNHIKPAVANISVSAGGVSTSLDEAVRKSVLAGVTVVVAAANNNADACNYSPARAPTAITVGATNNTDARANFSNFGACLDIFAPGVGTVSLSNANDTSITTMSGTSMASPHVAGVAALFLETNQTASPATVANSIIASSTTGLITNAGVNSPNRLLYSSFIAPSPAPTPAPAPVPLPSCTGTIYTGTLSGTGAITYHSGADGFDGKAGTYQGTLSVSGSNQFSFRLEKKNLLTWTTVANSSNTTSGINVIYRGSAGKYRWRVYAVSGGGSYTLCSKTP